MSIDSLLVEAKNKFSEKQFEVSLDLCDSFLKSYPNNVAGLRLKSDLLVMKQDYIEAILFIDKAINLSVNSEPCDFFSRGCIFINIEDFINASKDFLTVLELSKCYNDEYYASSSVLYLAYAYVMMGDKKNADYYYQQLDNNSAIYVNRIITKDVMLKLISDIVEH